MEKFNNVRLSFRGWERMGMVTVTVITVSSKVLSVALTKKKVYILLKVTPKGILKKSPSDCYCIVETVDELLE